VFALETGAFALERRVCGSLVLETVRVCVQYGSGCVRDGRVCLSTGVFALETGVFALESGASALGTLVVLLHSPGREQTRGDKEERGRVKGALQLLLNCYG